MRSALIAVNSSTPAAITSRRLARGFGDRTAQIVARGALG